SRRVREFAGLCVALNAAIGAPPSEFAPRDSFWRKLEPVMWPGLFGGVVLGLIALAASAVSVRGSAIVSVVGSLSTAAGIVAAAAVSNYQVLAFHVVFVTVAMIPAIVAISALRRGKPRDPSQ